MLINLGVDEHHQPIDWDTDTQPRHQRTSLLVLTGCAGCGKTGILQHIMRQADGQAGIVYVSNGALNSSRLPSPTIEHVTYEHSDRVTETLTRVENELRARRRKPYDTLRPLMVVLDDFDLLENLYEPGYAARIPAKYRVELETNRRNLRHAATICRLARDTNTTVVIAAQRILLSLCSSPDNPHGIDMEHAILLSLGTRRPFLAGRDTTSEEQADIDRIFTRNCTTPDGYRRIGRGLIRLPGQRIQGFQTNRSAQERNTL